MNETGSAVFKCGGCGGKFPWKPQYAGKRIKCKCGHVTVAPAAPQPAPEEDLYDLAPDPHAATERSAVAPPPLKQAPPPPNPVPPSSGPSARSPDDVLARLGLPPQRVSHLTEEMLAEDRQATARLLEDSPLRDFAVPIALIAGGFALGLYELAGAPEEPAHSYATAAPQVLIRSALGIGLTLVSAVLAVAFLEVAFIGSLRKSILKLCAIAVGPAAVQGIMVESMGLFSGSALGALAALGLYTFFVWYLLRLSIQDTAMLVIVIWILVTAANYLAFQIEGAISGAWI